METSRRCNLDHKIHYCVSTVQSPVQPGSLNWCFPKTGLIVSSWVFLYFQVHPQLTLSVCMCWVKIQSFTTICKSRKPTEVTAFMCAFQVQNPITRFLRSNSIWSIKINLSFYIRFSTVDSVSEFSQFREENCTTLRGAEKCGNTFLLHQNVKFSYMAICSQLI